MESIAIRVGVAVVVIKEKRPDYILSAWQGSDWFHFATGTPRQPNIERGISYTRSGHSSNWAIKATKMFMGFVSHCGSSLFAKERYVLLFRTFCIQYTNVLLFFVTRYVSVKYYYLPVFVILNLFPSFLECYV